MVLKRLIFLLCVLSISGCATARVAPTAPDQKKVRDFAEIYRRAKESGLSAAATERKIRLGPDIGNEKPYYPVYQPPRIAKVWVPAHTAPEDRKVMVAGHWTFVMVEDPHWYIEDAMSGDGPVPVTVPVAPQKE